MNLTGSSSSFQKKRKKGFALILTLALISFVFLLVITLVNQVRMEFSFTESRQNQILAKAHARMGMMIAIGEIQKHLGPDMRISATADIYDERIDSGKKYYDTSRQEYGFYPGEADETFLHLTRTKYPLDDETVVSKYPSDNLESVDLYESTNIKPLPLGQRQWTGVWKHRGFGTTNGASFEGTDLLPSRDLPFNSDDAGAVTESWSTDDEYDHHPAVEQAWLVSGNEGWKKKLGIVRSNQIIDFIEVPDGKYINSLGERILPSPLGKNYANEENPWMDHEQVVLEMNLSGSYHHPLVMLPDPADESNNFQGSEQTTWLLKQPLLSEKYDPQNSSHQANWKNYLVAEPVKVLKTPIISTENTQKFIDYDGWEDRAGSYAYWVGDEGVKAKINIMEPFEMDGEKVVSTLDKSSKLMVASSPNLQKGSFGFDFTPGSKTDDENRKDLISTLSIKSLLDEAQDGDTDAIAANYFYHSMTTDSFGVLADVRTGGLKRDLSLAFADDNLSKLWKTDFNNNWIYRDRINYKKYLPLFTEQLEKLKDQFTNPNFRNRIRKNQWVDSAGTQTVLDYDVMLTGPLWSVLASYHKMAGKEILEIEPHSTFPRMIGDNMVTFNPDESPESPGGAFPPPNTKENRYKIGRFFNCFGDKYSNRVRPEPKNHPIVPILTRLQLSFNICIKDTTTNEVIVSINPAVSLWNPYNKPLYLKDTYIYLPCNQTAPINIQTLDLAEYDLFRKWWMYTSAKKDYKGYDPFNPPYIKDPTQPWGIFEYALYNENKGTLGETEYGLMSAPITNESYVSDKSPKMDLKLEERTIDGNSTKVYVYYHENPRDGVAGEFIFTSLVGTRTLDTTPARIHDVYLKISDTVLEPGESGSFNVISPQGETYSANKIPEILLEKGDTSDSFALGTGVKNFVFGSYDFNFQGFNGLSDNSDEKFRWDTKEQRFKRDAEASLRCIKMYKWLGNGSFDHLDATYAQPMYAITEPITDSGSGRADQVQLTTKRQLLMNWENRAITGKIPGRGWTFRTFLPGDLGNERITLNDFNLRHSIHSNQHGMGYFVNLAARPSLKGHIEDGSGRISFKRGKDTYVMNPDDDENKTTFVVPHDNSEVKDREGNSAPAVKDKAFPDIFEWVDNTFDEENWASMENKFRVESAISDNIQDRAIALGFVTSPDYNLLSSADYPENFFRNPNQLSREVGKASIPRYDDSTTSGGFYLEGSSTANPISPEKYAVLFDVPNVKTILSLLQYRHANLNSYLHGPTYALGNSYASTQVARHNSYGRVQTIQYAPTSARGLTSSEIEDMDKMQTEYLEDVIKLIFKGQATGYGVEGDFAMTDWGETGGSAFGLSTHGIDLTQGFAPWRKDEDGSQLNHQNITVDHSFYLNRALLDGFFLSGISSNKQPFSILATEKGLPYRPFVYDSTDNTRLGNSRLVGFFREGEWKKSSYENDADANSPKDEIYRYQTIAADLLVDGAFNINSTSVDAWIAQLSSLRGSTVVRRNGTNVSSDSETPVVRFLEEPDEENTWNQFRKLSDKEISRLAKAMVKQVKLRGPFLSFSDFVNRRLAPGPDNSEKEAPGSTMNFMKLELNKWSEIAPENISTVTGLRGAVQSAIAESGLNDSKFLDSWKIKGQTIPVPPNDRWSGSSILTTEFGLRASTRQFGLIQGKNNRFWGQGEYPPGYDLPDWALDNRNYWGKKITPGQPLPNIPVGRYAGKRFKPDKYTYRSNEFGEAPENLLAVEHLASGANKPGWVMQSDILSPLAPVSSARSDTFTIRVMGESGKDKTSNVWIELIVQRTPDYIKPDLDAPHHRPHEPFWDKNLNGFWDNGNGEKWLDLNRNGDGTEYPDMQNDAKYREGMLSDKRLSLDGQEEIDDEQESLGISFLGINQRFGRKFKIVRFRWLRANEV